MPETQIQPTPPQKHLHPGIWIPVIVIVTAIVSYFFWANQSKMWPFAELPPTPSLIKEGEKGEFQGWQTYRNEELGFEFKYPPNFLVGKYKPEVTPVDNVPPDLRDKLSDKSWNNAVVLVESELIALDLLKKSVPQFSLDSIPVGEISTISIKPITTSASFYRRNFIDKTEKIQIGNHQVAKLPGYPGPYGDSAYYYLLPLSDNLIIEFTGHKERFNNLGLSETITEKESHYDRTIESIISTFKFTYYQINTINKN